MLDPRPSILFGDLMKCAVSQFKVAKQEFPIYFTIAFPPPNFKHFFPQRAPKVEAAIVCSTSASRVILVKEVVTLE